MKKPELLVSVKNLDEVKRVLAAGADAVDIGDEHYALRPAGYFTREEISETVNYAHSIGKKVYVLVNALLHNDSLAGLREYLLFLQECHPDALVFGDPGVLMTCKEEGIELPLHWNGEMTVTNAESINYWGRKGAVRAVLARELNLDSILDIKAKTDLEVQVQVHGMTAMFHSKRPLVTNYFSFQGRDLKVERTSLDRGLYLRDEERNSEYPIFEDKSGTHIMSGEDICMIHELPELLDEGIDSFKIEGLMKSTEYNEHVVKLYCQAIDLYLTDPDAYEEKRDDFFEQIETIQPVRRPLTTGFFFKEQVY